MKTIEPILIWTNGLEKEASVLNAYAENVNLNQNATFIYSLHDLKEDGNIGQELRKDTIFMDSEEYALWNTDDVAWDFIASKLNLVITGDYIKPIPVPPIPEITEPTI
jgi:hypothetical protein